VTGLSISGHRALKELHLVFTFFRGGYFFKSARLLLFFTFLVLVFSIESSSTMLAFPTKSASTIEPLFSPLCLRDRPPPVYDHSAMFSPFPHCFFEFFNPEFFFFRSGRRAQPPPAGFDFLITLRFSFRDPYPLIIQVRPQRCATRCTLHCLFRGVHLLFCCDPNRAVRLGN